MNKPIILRIPIIPGVNDTKEDFDSFGKVINSFGGGILRIELLKYNNMAKTKYSAIDAYYTEFAKETQSDAKMRMCCDYLGEMTGIQCICD